MGRGTGTWDLSLWGGLRPNHGGLSSSGPRCPHSCHYFLHVVPMRMFKKQCLKAQVLGGQWGSLVFLLKPLPKPPWSNRHLAGLPHHHQKSGRPLCCFTTSRRRRLLSATAFSKTRHSTLTFLGIPQPRETWQGSACSGIGARLCRTSLPVPRPLRPQKS